MDEYYRNRLIYYNFRIIIITAYCNDVKEYKVYAVANEKDFNRGRTDHCTNDSTNKQKCVAS